ncbi:MarR family winged helix-turn-helix transcriptional regulator [Mycetocola sp.]|uniref:MarR family winged helix-turn-helix transcriptional regulator n=1 Tax=Mycetocola sp. TaxID=1871042 RepID=UPI00398A0F28
MTRLRRTLRQRVRAEFSGEALPTAQVEILQRILDEPNLRISDLARKHRMAKNTVSTLVQQLVVKGLVERLPDAADRRVVRLTLTRHGEQSLRVWTDLDERLLATALRRIDESQRAAIINSVPALVLLAAELEHI